VLIHSVCEQIKTAIEAGELRAGSEIRQEELARRLGVSRQPIRQALPLLIAEGWIEALPNRRLLIRSLSADEVAELFAVRELLEPAALRESIPKLSAAALRRARCCVADYQEASSTAELEAADVALHRELYSGCSNTTLLKLIDQLRRSAGRVYELKPPGSAFRKQGLAEHRQLVALCEQVKVASAVALLSRHLETAGREVVAALAAPEGEPESD
jgi:DNA-binding GntR family transcriptional regulator